MPNTINSGWKRLLAITWLVWVTLWTVGLLRPETLVVRDAVIPIEFAFWASKSLHVVGYLALTLWPAWHFGRPHWLLVVLASVAHGMATEAIQPFCGRHGSILDVGWDSMGITAGLLLGLSLNGINSKKGQFGERP
jgi:VanZ family protein